MYVNNLTIPFVVEGYPDEMVIRRLAEYIGIKLERCYRMGSKQAIMKNIESFNERARFCPVIVLVDLNSNFNCAPELKVKWLPNPSQYICFRIAVREIEAWLLADNDNIAKFLGVNVDQVPSFPEMLNDPKQVIVNLARKSRKRDIRVDMVPEQGNIGDIGHAYPSRLADFARDFWNPIEAKKRSDSLRRCIDRLRELKGITWNDIYSQNGG